ncbi:GNAT family N-acetyltransferase [Aestuariibacter halophilus]|uniref:GNAT family N-acetyltransferase n=1 Tax=Fluctibacter halophilus TaxID=226011 RepID=A0ABS8G884_9ALTE|nr:GNAT family N-acetyltransferase [Aestuariibacter halophilus]MCC2616784.1 GNAT family N-acetyltransferase [Aestuariibacter halophilus]
MRIQQTPPEAASFARLRSTVGWTNPNLDILAQSITATLYWVCAYETGRLIATGRVIGDGAMYFYVQDVIVHPDHQGAGLGNTLMEHINGYLTSACRPGATVGLFAAKGKEGFYRKYQFVERCGESLGRGMCRFVV